MADIVFPGVAEAVERDLITRGVRQRVLALEAFLADAYGPGCAFSDGVVPWRLLFASGTLLREVAGFVPPNGVRVHVAAISLIRDGWGTLRVLGDNVRTPSGVIPATGSPRAIADHGIHHAREYSSRLLSALRAAAPPGAADPFVVVLTPGARHDAYLGHALLARMMNVALTEGRDLFCHRNRVYVRTARGGRPVDVIYRLVDDDWLDPVHFRPESQAGCPGLINAARAGNVTIANAVGNGVAGGELTRGYMPDLIRYYLGEEPLLANAGPRGGDSPDTPRWGPLALAINDGSDVRVLPGGLARADFPGRPPATCERDGCA